MTLTEHEICSRDGRFHRKVWFGSGPAEREHLLYLFLDGEVYLERMHAEPVIAELVEAETVPAGSWLFLSSGEEQERFTDLACEEGFMRFVAEEVVAWAREQVAGLRAGGHLIGGASLGGLASAYTTLRYPEVFSYALCQSGSFWWLQEHGLPLPRTMARFWLSVGDRETATDLEHPGGLFQKSSQIEGVEWAERELTERGAVTKLHHFSGGHAPAPWRGDLPMALRWLLEAE